MAQEETHEIVAVDIGGTNARFAIAEIAAGRVVKLQDTVTLRTAEYASLALAWEAFGRISKRTLPRRAGIAIACPIQGQILKMTNNPWIIHRAKIDERLGLEDHILVNDFGAVGHAVAHVDEAHLAHLCGPNVGLPEVGTITIVGPGTGLGAACLLRQKNAYHVIETEGGHIDFAPLDEVEDHILQVLRSRFRRVSVERIVSGPGLSNVYEVIAEMQGVPVTFHDNLALWERALAGKDPFAVAALERFCLSLGAVTGDLALTHRADAVVIAGGLGLRLAEYLPYSGFAERFVAKGRFEITMGQTPVKIITYQEPGLLGAAAAYAASHHPSQGMGS